MKKILQHTSQLLARALIGAFIGGVGTITQNENGTILGIIIICLGVSLFYGLAVFGTMLGTLFSNLGLLFYAVLSAGVIAVISSSLLEGKYSITIAAFSCMVLFYKRIEMYKPNI